MFQSSPYQQALFDEIAHGTSHVIVEAVAGSGKTTTLVEAIKRVPRNRRVLMCAFNAAIQKELSRRIHVGAEVRTLHSLGYEAIRRAWGGKLSVYERRGWDVMRDAMRQMHLPYDKTLQRQLQAIASRAKNYLAWDDPQIEALCSDTSLEFEPWVGATIRQAMYLSASPSESVSFDDMIYVPLYCGMMRPAYDVIFVDETQDLNLAQWTMIRQCIKPQGRIIAVGDRHQTIYGFRGARTDGMTQAAIELNARVLPLSVTYRCPRAVVRCAQRYVPAIEAAPNAPEGSAFHATFEEFWRKVETGDLVLSRTNRVVVSLCLRAYKRGIAARAIGRDLGKCLFEIIDEADTTSIPTLMSWLTLYEEHEKKRLLAAEKEEFIENLIDHIESIRALSEGLFTVDALRERIDELCIDDARSDVLRFSSVHRAKGLEEKRVWVVTGTFKLHAQDPVRRQEEENLYYVALTRAKESLGMIT